MKTMHQRGRAILMSLVERRILAVVCASIIWYSCTSTVSCLTGTDVDDTDNQLKKVEPASDKTTRTDSNN